MAATAVRRDRVCANCGTAPITGYRFCSPACREERRRRDKGMRPQAEVNAERSEARVQRLTRACEQCGVAFLMPEPGSKARAGIVSAGRFCSTACQREYAGNQSALVTCRRRIIKLMISRSDCAICSRVFVKRSRRSMRCSPECDAEQTRRDAVAAAKRNDCRDRSPRPCLECGVEFAPEYGNKRRSFCSAECYKRSSRRVSKAYRRARIRASHRERVSPIRVFERDGWRCKICGAATPRKRRGTFDPSAPEMDHIVPLADGGEHSYRNVQCLCRSCNGAKGAGAGGQLLLFG